MSGRLFVIMEICPVENIGMTREYTWGRYYACSLGVGDPWNLVWVSKSDAASIKWFFCE